MFERRIGRIGLFLAATLAACASGGSGGGGLSAGNYTRTLGATATTRDIQVKVRRVFDRNQFQIERSEELPAPYFETRWRGRTPFADERALGVEAARSRIVIRTRPRGRSAVSPDVNVVTIIVENQTMGADALDWETAGPSEDFREWAASIAEDLETELRMGIRGE